MWFPRSAPARALPGTGNIREFIIRTRSNTGPRKPANPSSARNARRLKARVIAAPKPFRFYNNRSGLTPQAHNSASASMSYCLKKATGPVFSIVHRINGECSSGRHGTRLDCPAHMNRGRRGGRLALTPRHPHRSGPSDACVHAGSSRSRCRRPTICAHGRSAVHGGRNIPRLRIRQGTVSTLP